MRGRVDSDPAGHDLQRPRAKVQLDEVSWSTNGPGAHGEGSQS
jgi:hypothetical protein